MKKTIFFSFFLIIAAFSCRKPQDPPAPSVLLSGNRFKVHFYSLNGNNETNKFANCTITFVATGELEVTKDGNRYNGDWEEYSNPATVNISISSNNPNLNLINREWQNDLLNPTRIKLVDDLTDPKHILILDLLK